MKTEAGREEPVREALTERKQFEAWYETPRTQAQSEEYRLGIYSRDKFTAWEAWQARAALAALPAQPVEALTESDLVALLPGPYYMDPPDGGDVSLLEQLRRMSEDAKKWRGLAALPAPNLEPAGEVLREALEIGLDFAREDAARAHELYGGYPASGLGRRYVEADRCLRVIEAALAALPAQPHEYPPSSEGTVRCTCSAYPHADGCGSVVGQRGFDAGYAKAVADAGWTLDDAGLAALPVPRPEFVQVVRTGKMLPRVLPEPDIQDHLAGASKAVSNAPKVMVQRIYFHRVGSPHMEDTLDIPLGDDPKRHVADTLIHRVHVVPAENAADHHEAPRSNEKDGGGVAGALPAIPAERSTAFLDWWHETGRKLPEGADMIERAFEAGRAAPVETAAPKPSLDHLAQEPRGGSKTPGGR